MGKCKRWVGIIVMVKDILKLISGLIIDWNNAPRFAPLHVKVTLIYTMQEIVLLMVNVVS